MAERGQFAQENEESAFLAFAVGIPIIFAVGWHFVGRYFYVWERIGVYGILSLWGSIPTDWPVLGWLTRQFLFFRYTPAKEVEFVADAVHDALLVNGFLMLPLLLLVLKRVLYIGKNHPFAIFGRTMNLYDYIFQQMPLYPHLRVMWKLRLLARPVREGLFRMADSEKRFCIRNSIVKLATLEGEPIVDERHAKRIFEAQLGNMLPMPTDDPFKDAKETIAKLSTNEKAILAAVVARLAVCDPDVSDQEFAASIKKSDLLVTQFWCGYDNYYPELPTEEHHARNPDAPLVPPPPPVDITGCDEILLKYLVFPRVRECMVAHAYVRTFIYDALQACRKVGKFSSTRFRWLRMTDRSLWLLVNSAGRNTPWWECAGLHAHFLWERKSGKAAEKPHVEEAITALQNELAERTVFTREQKKQIWVAQGEVAAEATTLLKPKPPTERPVAVRPTRSARGNSS